MVLVTHDVALAGAVSGHIFILGRDGLTDAFDGRWPGPLGERHHGDAERVRLQHQLEEGLVSALKKDSSKQATSKQGAHRTPSVLRRAAEPLGVFSLAVEHQPPAVRFPADYAHIFGRVMTLSVLRPAPFYGIVSLLLGFTFLFTMTHVVPEGVNVAALVRQIGGSYVTALAPALSAFLFVAASGNSVNAWIGGMGLTRQIAALEALGIRRENYLWAPTWLALSLSYLAVLVVFALGLLLGGLALCRVSGIHDGWIMLSSEFLDPRPGRRRFLARALWLSILYAGGIAADVVEKANREKPSAESVTRAMTSSVVASTLWVVTLELLSALWLISTGPRGQD
jgi:ABC-type transporter Mla maintaining outer membrane lipid asymmetry permease subunit MlaE